MGKKSSFSLVPLVRCKKMELYRRILKSVSAYTGVFPLRSVKPPGCVCSVNGDKSSTLPFLNRNSVLLQDQGTFVLWRWQNWMPFQSPFSPNGRVWWTQFYTYFKRAKHHGWKQLTLVNSLRFVLIDEYPAESCPRLKKKNKTQPTNLS